MRSAFIVKVKYFYNINYILLTILYDHYITNFDRRQKRVPKKLALNVQQKGDSRTNQSHSLHYSDIFLPT